MDALLQLLQATLASPWLYVLILAAAALDVLIPVIPSETMVITAGAFAVSGTVDPVLLVAATAAGAVAGDLIAHHVGRGAGPLAQRLRRLKVVDALLDWARRGLAERGGAVIVGGRFIPGGRTAIALTSGIVRFPRRRYLAFTAVAATLWALYGTGIGMLGGAVFEKNPLIGVALGIGIALAVSGGAEAWRAIRRRRAARTAAPEPEAEPAPAQPVLSGR